MQGGSFIARVQRFNTSWVPYFTQYAVIDGWHKILLGGGGLPNVWYHDGLPYHGADPTPSDECLMACNASTCADAPDLQIFDLKHDPSERRNLAPTANATLKKLLLDAVDKYNRSKYVDALSLTEPVETDCPFVDDDGVLTPCT